MLIRYFVENFLSFNDQIEFSLIPGKGSLLRNHVVQGKNIRDINILRTALIYGPNSSGKSNLIKSIKFAQQLIVRGTRANQAIAIKPFKLLQENINKPSKFQFDFKYKEKIYSYSFSVNFNAILEEYLYEIKSKKPSLIFERKIQQDNKSLITFDKKISKKQKDRDFLNFVAEGTRPNQLFLTESIQRNVPFFASVYEWFARVLVIIFPETKPMSIEYIIGKNEAVTKNYNEILSKFDTGVTELKTQKYNLEKQVTGIPEEIIATLKKDLDTPNKKAIIGSSNNDRYFAYKEQSGELVALKLIAKHKIKDTDKYIDFELMDESDGTRRIIDLLPALSNLLASERIFIIDELDRSLHPNLSRKIMEMFLNNEGSRKSQLIATTHESSLLDLKLLRKDEIWFVEKDSNYASKVYSLEEFKPRYDKDIRRGYLLGRFGAVPLVRTSNYK